MPITACSSAAQAAVVSAAGVSGRSPSCAELVQLHAEPNQVLQRVDVDVAGHDRRHRRVARDRRGGVPVQPRPVGRAGLGGVRAAGGPPRPDPLRPFLLQRGVAVEQDQVGQGDVRPGLDRLPGPLRQQPAPRSAGASPPPARRGTAAPWSGHPRSPPEPPARPAPPRPPRRTRRSGPRAAPRPRRSWWPASPPGPRTPGPGPDPAGPRGPARTSRRTAPPGRPAPARRRRRPAAAHRPRPGAPGGACRSTGRSAGPPIRRPARRPARPAPADAWRPAWPRRVPDGGAAGDAGAVDQPGHRAVVPVPGGTLPGGERGQEPGPRRRRHASCCSSSRRHSAWAAAPSWAGSAAAR